MEPSVGRSIREGFRVANRSWAGIGFFIGMWLLFVIIAVAGLTFTNPPQAIMQQAMSPVAPAASPPTVPAPSSKTQTTDLFKRLATAENPIPPTQNTVATAGDITQAQPAQNVQASQRDRLISEWFRRAWPMLLLCLAMFLVALIWLTGGQIGYLGNQLSAKRARVSDFWVIGTQAFGSFFVGTLLWVAVLAGLALVVALIEAAFAALSTVVPGWVIVVLSLLLGLTIIVGLVWLFIRLAFWFLVIVLERQGPIASLKASFRVSRGRWWQVFGLGLLMALISYGAWVPFGLLEWIGNIVGGATTLALGIIASILGGIVNLYVGFAALAAYICLYEDAKTSPPITRAAVQ